MNHFDQKMISSQFELCWYFETYLSEVGMCQSKPVQILISDINISGMPDNQYL